MWDLIIQTALSGPATLVRLLDERVDWWLQLATESPTTEADKGSFLPWNEGYCLLSKEACLIPSAIVKLGSDYKQFAAATKYTMSSDGFVASLSHSVVLDHVDDSSKCYSLHFLS